jgi:hypothetical protein
MNKLIMPQNLQLSHSVQSVSEGRVKESISERFTREWNDYLQAVKRYGTDYFSEYMSDSICIVPDRALTFSFRK